MRNIYEPKTHFGAARVASIAAALLLSAGTAHAEDSRELPRATADASWSERYERARQLFLTGEMKDAAATFEELSRSAPSEADRVRATEMARLARAWVDKQGDERARAPRTNPRRRSTDEMSVLYAHAFLYGAGTGAWFMLETHPRTAAAGLLPLLGFTGASVGAVALVDANAPFPRGVPHSIAAGLYLGLGEGVWVAAMQHARAKGLSNAGLRGPEPWSAEEAATVLWSAATLGGIAGASLGYGRRTTPGRVSLVASGALWGGIVSLAFTSSAALDGPYRGQTSFLGAGAGYNAGLFAAMIAAPSVNPSVARVRFVDLGGLGGSLFGLGTYAAIAGRDGNRHAAAASLGAGALLGLGLAWKLTDGMADRSEQAPAPSISTQPSVNWVPGGATIGATGTF